MFSFEEDNGSVFSAETLILCWIMKKEKYHSVLNHCTVSSGLHIIGQNLIRQQDNDPKHSSKLYKFFFVSVQSKMFWELSWPL